MVHRDPIRQGGDKEPHLIIQSATAFLRYPLLCYNHGTQTLKTDLWAGHIILLFQTSVAMGGEGAKWDSIWLRPNGMTKQRQAEAGRLQRARMHLGICPYPQSQGRSLRVEASDQWVSWQKMTLISPPNLIRSQRANCIDDHSLLSLDTSWARQSCSLPRSDSPCSKSGFHHLLSRVLPYLPHWCPCLCLYLWQIHSTHHRQIYLCLFPRNPSLTPVYVTYSSTICRIFLRW